jgi:hypothetical protein
MTMTTSFTVSSEGSTTTSDLSTLNGAIRSIDVGGTNAATSQTYTITLSGNITLNDVTDPELLAINLPTGSTLTIQGANFTLNGGGNQRGFFVLSGQVGIENLTIADTTASGGAGGAGLAAGGGGMGAGGGLFVNTGAVVTLTNVTFTDDAAVGGDGGRGAYTGLGGGGGGMGGAGGSGNTSFDGNSFGGESGGSGGGGLGLTATGGAGGAGGGSGTAGTGSPGGIGVAAGAASGGTGAHLGPTTGPAGGANGGGGGGGFGGSTTNHFPSGGGGGGGIGGANGTTLGGGAGGDFGGGGGAGGTGATVGGTGGFGGGGGATFAGFTPGADGGFGGGGGGGEAGGAGAGGFGGGDGGPSGGAQIGNSVSPTYPGGGGGGGAGFGGAVFVRNGGTLTIQDGDFGGGAVQGGTGGVAGTPQLKAGDGQAAGTAMFLQGSGTVTYQADVDKTVADTIVDEAGFVATTPAYTPPAGYTPGSYVLAKTGAAMLVLAGANAYSGGTDLDAGTLDLAVQNAAGIGEMNFGGSPATLRIETAALDNTNHFGNKVGVFRVGEIIDLRGIGSATSAPVDSGTDVLTIAGGTVTVTLQLDPLLTYGGFRLTSDLNGGTDVVLVPTITTLVGAPANGADVELQGTAQAGDTLTFFDENNTTIGTGTVAANGTFDVTMTTPFADGVHTVTATETDTSSGLTSPASDPFTVDVLPSAPVITTLVNAQPVLNGTRIELKGTAEANETVHLFLDGGGTAVASVVADGSGNFDITTSTPIADGVRHFTATETDSDGLTSAVSDVFTVDVFPNAPVITTLVNPQPVVTGTPIELKGTAEANETVNLFVDGGNTAVGNAVADINGNFDVTTSTPIADGVRHFTATETDSDGLASAVSNTFVIDVLPSAPVITTLVGTPVNGSQVELKGTAEANETVNVFADGGNAVVGTVAADGNGNFDVVTTATFADGVHIFTATDTDTDNLTSASSTGFTVDVLPTAPVIASVSGQPGNGAPVEVKGSGEAGETVNVFVAGGNTVVGTGTVRFRYHHARRLRRRLLCGHGQRDGCREPHQRGLQHLQFRGAAERELHRGRGRGDAPGVRLGQRPEPARPGLRHGVDRRRHVRGRRRRTGGRDRRHQHSGEL